MIYYLFNYNSKLPGVNKKIKSKILKFHELGLKINVILIFSEKNLNLSEFDESIFEKHFFNYKPKKSNFFNNYFGFFYEYLKTKKYYDFLQKIIEHKNIDLLIKRYGNEDINSYKFQKKINHKIIYEVNTLQYEQNIQKWNYKNILASPSWVSYIVNSEVFFGKKCLNKAKAIVSVTNEISKKLLLKKHIQPEKSIVISNGIEITNKISNPKNGDKINLLMILGVNSYWNGEDLLIKAIHEFNKDIFRLYIIGENTEKIDSDKVKYLGLKDSNEILKIIHLNNIHIGVGTLGLNRKGLSEACPLKVREYISLGLPVLYNYNDTDIDLDKEFRDNFCIKLEDKLDLEKVINQFKKISSIKDYNLKIKEWGIKNLSIETKISKYINVIEKINLR